MFCFIKEDGLHGDQSQRPDKSVKQNSQLSLPIHIKEHFPRYYHNKAYSSSCNNKTSRLYCFLLILVNKKEIERLKIFLPVKGGKKRGNRRKIDKIARESEVMRLQSVLVTG